MIEPYIRTAKFGDIPVHDCFPLNKIWKRVVDVDVVIPEQNNKVITQSFGGSKFPMISVPQYNDDFRVKIVAERTSHIKRVINDYHTAMNNRTTRPNDIDWTLHTNMGITFYLKQMFMSSDIEGSTVMLDCRFGWFSISYEEQPVDLVEHNGWREVRGLSYY